MKENTNLENTSSKKIHVVGIGASAGGLDALQILFDSMPDNTGMAFVIVQHLSPTFKSMMDELLSKHTQMPISLAKDNIELEPNHVYLNPKEKNILYKDGKIKHQSKINSHPLNLPIDLFFHSLGEELEEKSIGIILSGTGTDGSRGIGTIKGAGGTVMVQSPETAQFDGMPVTAINAGLAEFVVPPEKMGEILSRLSSSKPTIEMVEWDLKKTENDVYHSILDILYKASGIPFKLYKNNTLYRRIEKRLTIKQFVSLEQYEVFLSKDKEEQNLLVKDCLIGVTSFFRDPEAFEVIRKKVFKELFKEKEEQFPVRLWVSACSTGEEAYSLAILINEYIRENKLSADFKIFATDADPNSIQIAAAGRYPVNHITDIPQKIVERYFFKIGDYYEINKRIREKIVFSRHNLLKDPPFIKMDFISCRNFLIYLLPKVQYKVTGTFQFSLNKGGFLFLGHSENLGESKKMFKTIDSSWRVFQSVADYKTLPSRLQTDLRLRTYENKQFNYGFRKESSFYKEKPNKIFADKLASEFGPDCVFIDRAFNVLYINGNINDFTELKPGVLQNNLLEILADEQIVAMTRNGVRRLFEENKKIIFKELIVKRKSEELVINLSFQKYSFKDCPEDLVLLSFEKTSKKAKKENVIVYDQYKLDEFSKQRIEDLEVELKKAKLDLQNTIEELETSNEELQASNEELQASNEELQSTNEELQSVNEELYTVNAEVQVKNKELIDLNDDINNLLDSTEIGTLFLDTDLRIRKFTPALQKHFNLKIDDVGRPISSFASNFSEDIRKDFINDTKKVISTKKTIEKEFVDDDKNYFLRKITPFLKSSHDIEGAIISLVNITRSKKAEQEVAEKTRFVNNIYNSAVVGVYVYDIHLSKNLFINSRIISLLGYTIEEMEGNYKNDLTKLLHPEDRSRFEVHIGNIKNGKRDEVFGIEFRLKHKNNNWVFCYSCDTVHELNKDGQTKSFIGTFIDITERKEVEASLANNEKFLNGIFKNSETAIFVVDVVDNKDVVYAGVNPSYEKITGLKSKEMEGKKPEDLKGIFSEANLNEIKERYATCIKMKGTYEYEEEVNISGREIFWLTKLTSIMDEEGNVVRIIGNSINITEIKMAERELRKKTDELEKTNNELQRFNKAAVGRELKMIELKSKINELSKELSKDPVYDLSFAEEGLNKQREYTTNGEQ